MGGGSRNALWNQIKANALDMPVKVLDDAETTVAGAAMYGWFGAGEFCQPGTGQSPGALPVPLLLSTNRT
ncbi:L-fuculokinase [Raoultella terrigena]|uniref:L-fuculokinase n=1 Tax=Raoultella terrigena TaxID=577 RepID=A0A4U9D2C9_RAOTE|nr:L-fuculokinase [Raoultella terrigena]